MWLNDALHRARDVVVLCEIVVGVVAEGGVIRAEDDVAAPRQLRGVPHVGVLPLAREVALAAGGRLVQREHRRQPLALRGRGRQVKVPPGTRSVSSATNESVCRMKPSPFTSSVTLRVERREVRLRSGSGPIACCIPARMCARLRAQSCGVVTGCSAPLSSR